MKMKLRKLILFFPALAAMAVVLSFQNCSNVSLSEKTDESSQATAATIENKLCAFDAAVQTSPVNVNFVIDMSASNLGLINTTIPPLGTFCNFITTSDQSVPQFLPSDVPAQRIEEMIQFVKKCGRSSFMHYSVAGFSSDSFFATNKESCTSPFVSDTLAIEALEKLKLIQADYLGHDVCHRDSFNYMESNTSYKSALTCLKTKISSDLNLNLNLKPSYYSILATDGVPFEPDVQVDDSVYLGLVDDIKYEVVNFGASFSLNPIYYGVDPATKGRALQLLDQMAKRSSPTAQVQLVSNFANTADQWCQAIETKKYEFTLNQTLAVNINAINDKGVLLTDSDADGVADRNEDKEGFDKKNPRTFGILDSLCRRSGVVPRSKCQSLFTAGPEVFVVPGLTNHDLEAAQKIFGSPLSGVDTDSDGIPDYVEIVRGLNPIVKDAHLDSDLDGMTNRDEISRGLDPVNSDKIYKTDGQRTLKLSTQKLASSSCSAGKTSYGYALSSVKKTSTLGFADTSPLDITFSAKANENQVWIYTLWKNEASARVPGILYLQSVKISGDQGQFSSNVKLGEVAP